MTPWQQRAREAMEALRQRPNVPWVQYRILAKTAECPCEPYHSVKGLIEQILSDSQPSTL